MSDRIAPIDTCLVLKPEIVSALPALRRLAEGLVARKGETRLTATLAGTGLPGRPCKTYTYSYIIKLNRGNCIRPCNRKPHMKDDYIVPSKSKAINSAEEVLRVQLAVSESLRRISIFNTYSARIEQSFGNLEKELQSGANPEADDTIGGDAREIVETQSRRLSRIETLWQLQTYQETGAFGDFEAFWKTLTPAQQAAPDNWFKSWYLTVWDAGRMLRLPTILTVGTQTEAYLSMKDAVAQYRALMSDKDARAAAPFPQANQYYKYDGTKIRLVDAPPAITDAVGPARDEAIRKARWPT